MGVISAIPGAAVSRRMVDRANILSFAERQSMGAGAADQVAEELRSTLRKNGSARVIFAAAPSQREMLSALIHAPGIDWSNVIAFHMDDYIGLPAQAPQRFSNWLKVNLFDALPFGAVHLIAATQDAEAEARRYAALLAEAPIDIVCLGIGVNGHIAFNDPPVADFNDPLDVKVVELDDICRQQQVDDACFARLEDVPLEALTLTAPRLMNARRLFCVVPGAVKRAAVRASLYGPVSTACPGSILRSHPDCTFFLDRESDPDA